MPAILNAAATHGGQDMAVATGRINEDSEAVFFLDFKTGELSCFLYYPRLQRFGGKYVANVTEQLSATKNAEYLMVAGQTISPGASSNNRPAQTLVYVVDTKSGQFAAYGLAYNHTLESAGQPQGGPLFFVGGGEIRPPSAGGTRRSLPAGLDPAAGAAPGAAVPADPNQADPNAANQNPQPNPNVPNRNNRRQR